MAPVQTVGRAGPEPGESVMDDPTLVGRARDGDLPAFEALMRRYQGRIYRLALRMTADAGDAEEVTQDVFLSAWRRLPEIREDAAFSGWLYRTATNRCLNLLRRRRPTSELDDQVPNQVEADPQRATQSSAQLEALVAALQHLTPEQRAVWLLREAHHRSYEEIAQVVGTTPQAVRGRLSRARAQLAELISPWR